MFPAALAQYLTADGLVASGAVLYRGAKLLSSADTGVVACTLYDGIGSDATKPIDFLSGEALSVGGQGLLPGAGIYCERGLRADLGATQTVVIYYTPLTRIMEELGITIGADIDVTALGLAKLFALAERQV